MTAALSAALTALLFTLDRVRVAILGLSIIVLVKAAFVVFGLG